MANSISIIIYGVVVVDDAVSSNDTCDLNSNTLAITVHMISNVHMIHKILFTCRRTQSVHVQAHN